MRKVTLYLSNGKKEVSQIEATTPEIQRYYVLGSKVNTGNETARISALSIEH
jgi:hypothetical protein